MGTNEYVFRDLDGRYSYTFMVRSKKNINDTAGSVDSNRVNMYLGAPAIYSIKLTSTDGHYDTYTITHTDGSTTEIVINHGSEITDISLTSTEGLEDTYTVTCSDESKFTFTVRNGQDGIGISSVEKTASENNIDTYTITFTDGSTSVFTVANGVDGKQGETGLQGAKGDKGDIGEKGEKGEDGKNGIDGKNGVDGRNGIDGKDGVNGKDGKDGIDGVGITDVKVQDGYLMVTLSDGKVINAGYVLSEAQTINQSGVVKTIYFNIPSDDIKRVTVNGDEITNNMYSVKPSGEGTVITINEEVIPSSGAEIKVETATTAESVKLSSSSSVPWAVIYAMLGWNAALTGAVGTMAFRRKKEAK